MLQLTPRCSQSETILIHQSAWLFPSETLARMRPFNQGKPRGKEALRMRGVIAEEKELQGGAMHTAATRPSSIIFSMRRRRSGSNKFDQGSARRRKGEPKGLPV